MAGLIFRQAVHADHVALEELIRATSMGSRIRLGFERDPDYFTGCRVQADDPCVHAAFEECGRAIGLFSAGERDVWLGKPTRMRYLSDMRVHPDYQGSSVFARGFRRLRSEVFHAGEWAQTLVLEGNHRALELLTSGRAGLPIYHPAGRYVSTLLPPQRISATREIHVRLATPADLPEMQALLKDASYRRSFSPLPLLENLGNPCWQDLATADFRVAETRGSLVGMMGLWDQSRFQRIRIDGYSPLIEMSRPIWNAFSSVRLPRPGAIVPLLKATAIACRDDDPAILRALLSAALAESASRLILLGMSVKDPLAAGLAGLASRKEYGRHFLVGWDGAAPRWREPFAFDVARI